MPLNDLPNFVPPELQIVSLWFFKQIWSDEKFPAFVAALVDKAFRGNRFTHCFLILAVSKSTDLIDVLVF